MSDNKVAVLVAIIVIGLYLALETGTTIFEAERVSGNQTQTDALTLPKSSNLAQSFFNSQAMNYTIDKIIQSSIPLSDPEGEVSFKTIIKNQLDEPVMIQQLIIYQNGEADSKQITNVALQPGMSTTFRTSAVKLQINEGLMNNVKLEFLMQADSGKTFTQVYEYNYYALKSCKNTDECDEGEVCDKENLARFSDGKETYCVDICSTNTDCGEGQLCFKGRCGYV